ncbi:MAG TPA: NAD(P)/FAD-dependent oxidoreductase [bacterium]|nr:NAD(P)/FAD-dependent oxidoreductase [bacterium]
MSPDADVLIIGAGPSGSLAAANLLRRGHSVLMVEKESFPRFSIGESLLPQTMGLLEEAGLLRAVVEAGFQYKNGAAFVRGERRTEFDFRDKFSAGWGSTYQVQRAAFDKVLADEVERRGARILYRHQITAAQVDGDGVRLGVTDADGRSSELSGRFVLDASGNAKVLPRLLKLEKPSRFPMRQAIFTHVLDGIPTTGNFDRNKILVTVHPEQKDVWYWLIPFSNGRCSLGVVASAEFLAPYEGDLDAGLRDLQFQAPGLKALLKDAVWDTPARQIKGYASDVSTLHGPNFALLGNAGEFLDPVFSSGVTIAFKSASLATELLDRRFKGVAADWETEYSVALRKGVDCFRAFVEAWYQGGFQDIIFYPKQDPQIKRLVCSILAGYAWDQANPYVAEPARLRALAEICAEG